MKKLSLTTLQIIFAVMFAGILYADDLPKRFSMPLDEWAEINGMFSTSYKNNYGFLPNSDFINYNISRDSFPQNETSVKISRKDPNRVVAAYRDFSKGVNPANRRVGYSYSTDAGVTWSQSRLLDSTLLPGFPRNSDPAVGVDTAGNFYIAVICIGTSGALAIYKSTDGGETFPVAVLIANTGSEDKEYITTDFTPGSPYKNNIYISWTRFSSSSGIKLTTSTNGGLNWSSAVAINDPANLGQGSDPAVGLNGEVYVTWLGGTATTDIVYFDKSTNGGSSFGTDVIIASGTTPEIPISSSGITFPSIATDISGGVRNGNIYATWCDARNGDPDIFISRSTNRGSNWSPPFRVNDDAVGNGKLQCWPWIAVNDSGNIAIIYYDSRNTSSNIIIEAFLAISTDGGTSFVNYKLSSVPTPTNQPNTAIRFGDYIGIDYYKNTVVPVWTDERAGGFNQECYTAIVTTPVSVISYANSIIPEYRLNQNFPNPFNPETKISYSIPQNGIVSLKVYDILGKEVAGLVNKYQNAGEYSVVFNASGLAGGTYFYKLQTDDFIQTKSMILLK